LGASSSTCLNDTGLSIHRVRNERKVLNLFGCVSLFCTNQEGEVNSREKAGERREHESEEEHTPAE
jgi:hypothetical protein